MRQRNRTLIFFATFTCLLLSGCVQKTEYDALQGKLNDATKELTEVRDSLKKSQDQLADLQAHRYTSFNNGGRTWRLDGAKGTTCVLLASDQEWKNPHVKRQSCSCEDFEQLDPTLRDGKPTSAEEVDRFTAEAKRRGCE
jgi:hypothetical protein